jgi:rhodanese-related sulfurtransferase
MTTAATISGAGLRERLAANSATVIDVREPGEFAGGHVPGSINVPLSRLPSHAFSDLAGREIVLVCASGRRSGRGCDALAALPALAGVKVSSLDGGVGSYTAAGGTLARTGKGVIPIERQVFAIAGFLVLMGVLLGSAVHPAFYAVSAFVGAGLMVAGLTGFCGMALLLAKAPWNQRAATVS